MQADAVLLEAGAGMLGRWSADRNSSAAADAVIDPRIVHHRLQPEEWQQLSVKCAGALDAVRKICAMPLTSINSPLLAISDNVYRQHTK